jgi:NAD(P)-dependent dehydrogenase (short-subunit alcohol dehydrogenase family)
MTARINPDGKLKGQVALVTGASRGIGEAIAVRLAMEGARVIAVARTANEGESSYPGTLAGTVARITAAGGKASYLQADLGRGDDRERLIAEALAREGRIDILVNNAAALMGGPFASLTEKRLKTIFEINVFAAFDLAQRAAPQMRERRAGAIINLTSGASVHGVAPFDPPAPGGIIYPMTKAALERFTTALAQELYPDNVSVNALNPGFIDTPGNRRALPEDAPPLEGSQPVEIPAEATYQLAVADPKVFTALRADAKQLLAELGVEPAALV